ncbi:LWR-salt protein [Haloarchaeobius litoreus]|uniref:LWR-salt protein n=1 Tax=Haloarchaeobius litoreus TaxID=755306 RepID=A0ABD6DJE8_9EURY
MQAAYVVRVRFRLAPTEGWVSVDPATFETTVRWTAPEPGSDGWLFFRDHCWHGEFNEPAHARELLADALGVPVEDASFSELRTDEAYLDALKSEVGADLTRFNADSTSEALSKYLGSSIHVVDER